MSFTCFRQCFSFPIVSGLSTATFQLICWIHCDEIVVTSLSIAESTVAAGIGFVAVAFDAEECGGFWVYSAFAEPHNVHAAALQNFGDVDQIVSDLVGLRKRVKQLEGELREMRDRYSTMSLRFAEVEAQREDLVMTVRTLRNAKKQ